MKTRIQLHDALKIAADLQAEFEPACERIEIAGSLRREERTCGDIEFVLIAKQDTDLYGQPTESQLNPLLHRMVEAGKLERGRANGEKLKQYIIPAGAALQCSGLMLELYITTPEKWGVIFAIRTGSADYAQAIVTERARGGLLADDHRILHGRVWRKGELSEIEDGQAIASDRLMIDGRTWYVVQSTPEERDVLALAGGYIEPPLRTRQMVHSLRGSIGFSNAGEQR